LKERNSYCIKTKARWSLKKYKEKFKAIPFIINYNNPGFSSAGFEFLDGGKNDCTKTAFAGNLGSKLKRIFRIFIP
jgi:hypothetical protein